MKKLNKNGCAVLAAILLSAAAVPVFAAGAVSEPYVPTLPVGTAVAETSGPAVKPAVAVETAPAPVLPSEEPVVKGEEEESSDADAAEAIKAAKRIFGNTDEYKKVETYSSKQGNLTLFDINWSEGGEKPNMNVSIGSDGVLYGYNLSNNVNYSKIVTPSITRLQAATKGMEFIKKVYPDIAGDFSIEYSTVRYSLYGRFSAEFIRVHDGYPVGEEYISITMDEAGEICSVSNGATYALAFPDPDTLSDSELISVIKSELPMKLRYESWYPDGYGKDKKAQIRLVYIPNDDYSRYFIGAEDGKLYTYTYDWSRGGGKYYANADMASASAPAPEAAMATEEEALSAAEQESVDLLNSMLTATQAAEKIIGDDQLLTMTAKDADIKNIIKHSRLYKETSEYTDTERYVWSLEFSDGESRWFSASVNADTGEIISFDSYSDQWKAASEYPLDYEACAKIADEFISARLPEISGEYERSEDDYWLDPVNAKDQINSYNFSYVRVVNGIQYQNDRIRVMVEPENGLICSFYYSWSDAEFPDPARAISADAAADACYRAAKLQRGWIAVETGEESENYDLIIASGNTVGKPVEAMLVTEASYFKIDAYKGRLLTNTYENETGKAVYSFSDISGHKYEAAISRLADMSIIEYKAKYEPDKAITESDLVSMINSAGGRYYRYNNNGELRDKLSRIDAIKVIVSTLGWDEIASHGEIFTLEEGAAINLKAEDTGYIAIVKALGILGYADKNYDVTRTFTRGEAAALVSSYIDYLIAKNG